MGLAPLCFFSCNSMPRGGCSALHGVNPPPPLSPSLVPDFPPFLVKISHLPITAISDKSYAPLYEVVAVVVVVVCVCVWRGRGGGSSDYIRQKGKSQNRCYYYH